jgi:hypothetical protein
MINLLIINNLIINQNNIINQKIRSKYCVLELLIKINYYRSKSQQKFDFSQLLITID